MYAELTAAALQTGVKVNCLYGNVMKWERVWGWIDRPRMDGSDLLLLSQLFGAA